MLGFGESLTLEEVMVKDLANDQLKGAHSSVHCSCFQHEWKSWRNRERGITKLKRSGGLGQVTGPLFEECGSLVLHLFFVSVKLNQFV